MLCSIMPLHSSTGNSKGQAYRSALCSQKNIELMNPGAKSINMKGNWFCPGLDAKRPDMTEEELAYRKQLQKNLAAETPADREKRQTEEAKKFINRGQIIRSAADLNPEREKELQRKKLARGSGAINIETPDIDPISDENFRHEKYMEKQRHDLMNETREERRERRQKGDPKPGQIGFRPAATGRANEIIR